MAVLSWLFGTLAALGCAYTLFAAFAVSRRRPARAVAPPEPVTLLKPLHGAEPRLAANLASFLDQDWPAPIEMVAGVSDAADPAAGIARGLGAIVVADATRHGANGKVSNLVNMLPAAGHDLLVLSDSDMAVPRGYLRTVAAALAEPGTGAASFLYRGRGDAGGWSRCAAAGVSYGFLPAVATGLMLGLAHPCMGSTIALRRATLAAIGGFAAFADRLADDYAIGAAVRAQGLAVAIPDMLLVHGHDEANLAAVWRHELRWASTIRGIDPLGHLGTVVSFPVPFALFMMPLSPLPALALLLAGLGSRLVLKAAVDRRAGASSAPAWWLPGRDCLSFAVFMWSFVVRSVDWRGKRLRMEAKGRIAPTTESFPT